MMKAWQLLLCVFIAGASVAATWLPQVIYGEDSRVDIFELEDPELVALAASTAAVVRAGSLYQYRDEWRLRKQNYGETYNLCEGERFAEQPIVATCSAFFVGEDLLVTAGHCVYPRTCNQVAFVFDYVMLDEENVHREFQQEQVYRCQEVIEHRLDRAVDHALIRVDRVVEGRDPLPLRRHGRVEPGEEVFVIGHPAGLPTKYADGAFVREWRGDDYFVASLDTYGGNSGSAVFNARTREVEGILVRGASDFSWDFENNCRRSNVCDIDGCRGEDVSSIQFLEGLIPRTH